MSLLDLPIETVDLILNQLPVPDILHCVVCKKLKEIIYSDFLWKNLCQTIYGLDTNVLSKYSGQWRNIVVEGKAPWINLQNKRYIRKIISNHISKSLSRECIDYDICWEDLVLNQTTHFSSSYSPSRTIGVAIMDTKTWNLRPIQGFDNIHFKKCGNYLLSFEMDQFSCIYPDGVSFNQFCVFQYDANRMPESNQEMLFKVEKKSEKYSREPKFFVSKQDPEYILFGSHMGPNNAKDGPLAIEIHHLKTEKDAPIKTFKIRGDIYTFNGDYFVISTTGSPETTVQVINWRNVSEDYPKNLVECKHPTTVTAAIIDKQNLACLQASGTLTIWDLKSGKIISEINCTKYTNHPCGSFSLRNNLLTLCFNPTGNKKPSVALAVVDWRRDELIEKISTTEPYLSSELICDSNGKFSGKILMSTVDSTNILVLSSPYLLKKFDVAVLSCTESPTKMNYRRARVTYGSLVDECSSLIQLKNGALLTSQILLERDTERFVLLFAQRILESDEDKQKAANALTHLLRMTTLTHNALTSPYGGLSYDGNEEKLQPSVRRRTTPPLDSLAINGPCLFMKETLTADFGWVPTDIGSDLVALVDEIHNELVNHKNRSPAQEASLANYGTITIEESSSAPSAVVQNKSCTIV